MVNGDTIRLLPQAQAFVEADDAQLKAAGTHALPTIKRHHRDGAATRWRNEGFAMSAIPLRPAYEASLMHITFP